MFQIKSPGFLPLIFLMKTEASGQLSLASVRFSLTSGQLSLTSGQLSQTSGQFSQRSVRLSLTSVRLSQTSGQFSQRSGRLSLASVRLCQTSGWLIPAFIIMAAETVLQSCSGHCHRLWFQWLLLAKELIHCISLFLPFAPA